CGHRDSRAGERLVALGARARAARSPCRRRGTQAARRLRTAAHGDQRQADQPAAVRVDGDPRQGIDAGTAREAAEALVNTDADVVIIGAGPAGLSAALNLARARRRVTLLDSNRPRNSVTLVSHGFLTRDGVTPHELRRLGLAELAAYPGVEHHLGQVETVTPVDSGFEIRTSRVNASPARTVTAPAVLIASGLRETLPALPSMAS